MPININVAISSEIIPYNLLTAIIIITEPPHALATAIDPNIRVKVENLLLNFFPESPINSSILIVAIGAITPRIIKEDKTAIAAALPK